MNIELRRAMTVEEYLAWAQDQADGPRTELINGQIVAMSPERVVHNRIKNNVYLALRSAVARAAVNCEVFSDGLTVPIDEHTAYEPDASVRCGSPLSGNQMKIADPVIVAEVLSPTSRHHDTSAKLIGYFKLPSVAHYLVVDPDLHTVTHYTRDDSPATLRDGALRLDPPGIELAVADLLG
jgi:Uma2 family endonuclease